MINLIDRYVPKRLWAYDLWPAPIMWSFRALSAAFGSIIIVTSLMPVSGKIAVQHADKLAHLLAYGALAGAMRLGWPKIWGGLVFITASSLGIGLEFAQHLHVPSRTGSLGDAIANMSGAFLALIVIFALRRRG